MLEILPKKEIQKLIGKGLYSSTADFIDKLTVHSSGEEEFAIYMKDNMLRLLLSLGIPNEMKRRGYWTSLLKRVSEEKKTTYFEKAEISGDSDKDLVFKCLKYEYSRLLGFTYIAEKPEAILNPFEVCKSPDRPFKMLKKFQVEVYSKAVKLLEIPKNRFILQMPTGSGKTRTGMEVIASHLLSNLDGNVVWLAHSGELLEQAGFCFKDVWEHVGQRDLAVCICDQKRKGLEMHFSGSRFIAGTFQTFRSLLERKDASLSSLLNDISLIVVDEAHMSLAPTYIEIIRQLLQGGACLMGLTATPGRGKDDSAGNQALSDLYFNNMVELDTNGFSSVFEFLRSEKILSKVSYKKLPGSNYSLTQKDAKKISMNLDIPEQILNDLAANDLRNVLIINKLLEIRESCQSIILFACNVEHSKFLSSIANYVGIRSFHVDGSTPSDQRAAALEKFKSGEIQLLSNYGVLSTGFDAPKTDAVFIARPTSSIVLYSQMIGRGLRGPAIGGTEKCTIVNVIDNLEGLPSDSNIFDYFADYYVR